MRRSTIAIRACFCVCFASFFLWSPVAKADQGEQKNLELFKSQVLPILERHCFDCHSHAAGEANGGLVLDSLAGMEQGGTRGASLDLPKPERSLLLRAMQYDEPDLQMPPDGKLAAEEIEAVQRWIQNGAHVPAEMRGTKRSESETGPNWQTHWAYQPIHSSSQTVDELLHEGLTAKGLSYSPRADRRTLLRRLQYDLLGLPADFSASEAFLRDERPDKVVFEEKVDELLDSPHFGERWARYWMDIARYSDNKGYVFREDREYAKAYEYRDWLIRSLNEDLPYDEFVRLQLAADLISEDEKALPALGFLTLGRRFLNNKQDIIDDRLDVLARGLMGMTLACARCHDHKYDPITQKDYYSLYGVMLNTEEPGDGAWPHRLQDSKKQRAAFVLLRGNPGMRGDKVQRRFVSFLAPDDKPLSSNGSGRAELAAAILADENPLTARVFVNRVWMRLTGSSLVDTPSDFGLRCPPPVQLQLLDQLASGFKASGWSVKHLIRTIVLSDCYAQASLDRAAGSAMDPANTLYWRMNRRRLDFESLRDTLLATSGKLDRKQFGPSTKIETEPFSSRRSVYAYIDRQNLPSLFRTFDFASPDAHNARRIQTTVPQQGLFLLNSPFVAEQASSLSGALSQNGEATKTDGRIRDLFMAVLAREPLQSETKMFSEFIRTQRATQNSPRDPVWIMGYAKFKPAKKQLEAFRELPHVISRQAWQGGAELPDPKLGWCLLTPKGGHPGNDLDHAVVRRWVAPRDGLVRIDGRLHHKSDQGDGVRGTALLDGVWLKSWNVEHRRQNTGIQQIQVKRGATLDFVTDCKSNPSHDSFDWAINVSYENGKTYSSESGFPDRPAPPLDVWAQAAQALLLSNELIFVD